MKNILFIAPPAGGKGTQSDYLVNNYGYRHISSGDLLRKLDPNSELGKQVESLISEGKLVSDEIIINLIKLELIKLSNDDAFILDGFPRNITQAEALEKMLVEINKNLDVVIEINTPYEVCLKRIEGRISCPKCHKVYNKFFLPPKIENKCDVCGETLISRSDDNAESFKQRYNIYLESTTPLLDYYKNLNKLVTVNGEDNTQENIVGVIKND